MTLEATGGRLRYSSAVGRWVIVATVLGSAVTTLDSTIVGIALPTIGREFKVGMADLQWVSAGYMLTLSGLLLLGGALGDRHGRRRVFLFGVIWFGIASLLCGAAPDILTMILARGLQGIGAALLTPGSLAILEASFRSEDRGTAIGAWSGFAGVASAVGPFLGGYLMAVGSWRLIFLVNVPVVLAVLLITARYVPETRDPAAGPIDGTGAVLITVGLTALCYGLIEGPSVGFEHPAIACLLLVGAGGIVLFVVVESRMGHPLLPLGLFRSRQFAGANLVTFVVYAALGTTLFLLPMELQQVAHYSPLESGVALLPVTFIMLILSSRSGALASRIGPRLQMSVGPLVMAVGMLMLVRVGSSQSYFRDVLPAVLVFGLGLAINVAPLTAAVLAAAPTQAAGVASAANNDVARVGGLLSVAVLPSLAGITGASYLHPDQLDDGFRTAVLIAAALCASGGVLAALTIRNRARRLGAAGDRSRSSSHCALDAPPPSVGPR
ncbi:MAG TPA: DHA2 family efflux MFS transporter permease subunit [Candidatus Dormibacteraeota bacterium]|nr:DHA2 family efflux MFS transporter permease subunit [Candidatus Dormibacteraeota bacterium]